jgi:nucleoside-diphosphate-sugar epimerase
MKRVLVTGATGFVGQHCLQRLAAREFDVHALSRQSPRNHRVEITWHECNLFDSRRVAGLLEAIRPTHLLHLAWDLPDDLYVSWQNVRWVQASLELVQSFQRIGGRRCLVTGTCYEYDQRYGLCSEHRTPNCPNSVYGICKHSLQQLLAAFSNAAGLSFAWPRLFYLYGPGENARRLVPSVVRAVLRGEVAACSHGRQVRDYLYVGDVADGLVVMLDSDIQGPINLGSGVPVTLRTIVAEIGTILGRPDLIRFGAVEARSNDVPLVVADTSRAASELDWRPATSVHVGLGKTIAWWRQRLAQREAHVCHDS